MLRTRGVPPAIRQGTNLSRNRVGGPEALLGTSSPVPRRGNPRSWWRSTASFDFVVGQREIAKDPSRLPGTGNSF